MQQHSAKVIRFQGAASFRHRLAFSALSRRPVIIDNIRAKDESPGVREYELQLLRMLDQMSNGSSIEVSPTGTRVIFRPGTLGGGRLTVDCDPERGIGYFVEVLLLLGPFAKKPIVATLNGATTHNSDLSVDSLKAVTIPTLAAFGLEGGLELKVERRGWAPTGGGRVVLRVPTVRELRPVHLLEEGFVKRVRGVAVTTRVSPHMGSRMIDRIRGVLNDFLPDVYVAADHYSAADGVRSPGYGSALVASTTSGCLFAADIAAARGDLPEDVGREAAELLLEEVQQGGCVDSATQPLVLALMALSPEDVSRVRLGRLTPQSVRVLRLLKAFFGVVFRLEVSERDTLLVSCRGCGFRNLSKKVT